jgi:hypothetical protein
VHDLKLRGESDVAHQIDVTVGDDGRRKRILIECKDYADPVGLPEARSFWAVVDDFRPDEAFMVTTERFTGPAAKLAAAKGITAAVLRLMTSMSRPGLQIGDAPRSRRKTMKGSSGASRSRSRCLCTTVLPRCAP